MVFSFQKSLRLYIPFELTTLLERVYPKAIINQVNTHLPTGCSLQECYSKTLEDKTFKKRWLIDFGMPIELNKR